MNCYFGLGGLICLLVSAAPSAAGVLAKCGPSQGVAYYLEQSGGSWQTDGVTAGSLTFTSDDAGNVNLMFHDSTGRTTDAAAGGAEIVMTRIDAPKGEFSVLVVYPSNGVTESYNVLRVATNGPRRLLWTSSKARSGGVINKAGAYVSTCD